MLIVIVSIIWGVCAILTIIVDSQWALRDKNSLTLSDIISSVVSGIIAGPMIVFLRAVHWVIMKEIWDVIVYEKEEKE